VDGVIHYLNTDLDLTSTHDLTVLAAAFEAAGVFCLHVSQGQDGPWCACFETDVQHGEPEPNIAEILTVVERLDPPLRSVWAGCSLREFNIGYDCGLKPWAFNHGLSANLLGRMAAAGVSLRVTLYPEREPVTPKRRKKKTRKRKRRAETEPRGKRKREADKTGS